MTRTIAWGAVVLLAATSPLHAQAVLAGFVREATSEAPVVGVQVILEGSDRTATTDAKGKFVLGNLPVGVRMILFRLVGWQPFRMRVSLVVGDTVWVEGSATRQVVQLAPIDVVAEPGATSVRDGFEERRRLGFGRFIDSTTLRANENKRVEDLLRREGVDIRRANGKSIAVSTRRPGCIMQVILDGMILYRSKAPTSMDTAGKAPPDLGRDFDVSALSGIEVYRGAGETPSEFNGSGAGCGTIVLWSRRD